MHYHRTQMQKVITFFFSLKDSVFNNKKPEYLKKIYHKFFPFKGQMDKCS